MDYKWHGKFIIEIISKSCKKDGIAKSYLVHKARVGEMLISVITPFYHVLVSMMLFCLMNMKSNTI